MLPYIIIFFFILLSFLFVKKRTSIELRLLISGIVFIFFTLFIGLRHKVGGDWQTYLQHFQNLTYYYKVFKEALLAWDPGYVLLEYISHYLGLGIYGVNTLCAIIFLSCFFTSLRLLKLNYLMPY